MTTAVPNVHVQKLYKNSLSGSTYYFLPLSSPVAYFVIYLNIPGWIENSVNHALDLIWFYTVYIGVLVGGFTL